MSTLLIFDSHPIPYRSPVFRALPQAKVYFFDNSFQTDHAWFNERGVARSQDGGPDLRQGFHSELMHLREKDYFAQFFSIFEVIRRERPEALLIYGYYLPAHWMILFAARRLRIPLVFVGETFRRSPRGWKGFLKNVLVRFFLRRTTHVIAIGNKNAEYYRGEQKIAADRITQAKYCIDHHFFSEPPSNSPSSRARWRTDHRISPLSFVVLFVGRLFDRKRPGDLLEAQRRLAGRIELVTVFAGAGPLLQDLQIESALDANTRVLGFQTQEQLREAYRGADVLVVPSEFETWGLVVNEAFACGLPAIVTDTCGCADDLVQRGMTGEVYPVGDIARLSEYLLKLADRQIRETYGKRALERVRAEYGPEQFSLAIEAAISAGKR